MFALRGSHKYRKCVPTRDNITEATYISLMCTIRPSSGTVESAVGDISDPIVCMVGDQPAIPHGVFSHFAGATRAESVPQLVTIYSHMHAIAV